MPKSAQIMGVFRTSVSGRAKVLVVILGAMLSFLPQGRGTAAGGDRPNLDARIADLKAKTTALVSAGLAQLTKLSAQQRLAASPVIWRVPGAVTELKDNARPLRQEAKELHLIFTAIYRSSSRE